MLVILSGSSGSGKNTIINKFLNKSENNKFMLTNTTREIREGEVDGKIYNFVSKEAFQKKIKAKELIEHELIHGNFYGTSWKELNFHIEKGHTIFKDVGVQGTFNIADKCSEKTKVLKIFLYVPKTVLKQRLKLRGENNIQLRMKRFKYENSFIKKYDYVINNINLEKTCNYIEQIININMDSSKIYPVKNLKKISNKKIGAFIEKIKSGKQLKPVKVAITNNGIFLLNGIERYVASVKMKKDLCKIVVEKSKNFVKPNEDEWKSILEN